MFVSPLPKNGSKSSIRIRFDVSDDISEPILRCRHTTGGKSGLDYTIDDRAKRVLPPSDHTDKPRGRRRLPSSWPSDFETH